MDYSDDRYKDEFSSNEFDRMLAVYDQYRAEDQEVQALASVASITNHKY